MFHKVVRDNNTTWFCAVGVSMTLGLTTYEEDDEHKALILVENATALRGTFFDAAQWDAYFARRRLHLLANPYEHIEDGPESKHFPYPWQVDGGIDADNQARVLEVLGAAIKRTL